MAAKDITTRERVEFLQALIEHAMAERAALPEAWPHREKRRELRAKIDKLWEQLDLHLAVLDIEDGQDVEARTDQPQVPQP